MNARPKLVLFDFDDVLVDYRHDLRCAHIAEAVGAQSKEVERALFRSGLENRCDRGELELPDYLEALRSQYGLMVPQDVFIAARKAATRPRPEMLALCEQVQTQAAAAVFTNNGRWLGQHLAKVAPAVSALFARRTVTSGQLRAIKPEPKAFLLCLQALGFSPASTLFFDDRPENIEGARVIGIDAVVFESPTQVAEVLRARGFDLEFAHAP